MQQLLDYIRHHPFLAGEAAIALLIVAVYEIQARALAAGGVSAAAAVRLMNQGALVIDVRTKDAYEAAHIGEARNIPTASLAAEAEGLGKWRERNVIVYCDSGRTSAGAARTLGQLGFKQVYNLDGGIQAWLKDNLPVARGGGGRTAA